MTKDRATPLVLPSRLSAAMHDGGSRAQRAWIAGLPERVADLAARWRVRLGAPFEPGGTTAWVAPGVDADGDDVVLKIGWTHTEARDDVAMLDLMDGDGAVRVLRHESDGPVTAALLERCDPGSELAELPEVDQHPVVVDILRRVWATPVPASAPFRPLEQMCEEWVSESRRDGAALSDRPLAPSMADEGYAAFVELARSGGGATGPVLLGTDVHAANVLSSRRRPWLLIDPKPYVGDPHYDLLQHMLNCTDLLDRPRELIADLAALADLDSSRLQDWMFARCVVESAWTPTLAPLAVRLSR